MNNQHIHFIGICGVAMSALAIALKENGHKVTGSDKGFFPPVSTHLIKHDIYFYPGWHVDKMNADGDPDLVVVGNVAGSTNPEWRYVQEKNLKFVSYPQLIKQFFVKSNSIVCAGTYGKTSTSALLAFILEQVGFAPSYMFGGLCADKNFLSSHIGSGDWSVLEGDEYKSARWDMSPKFSHYSPTHLILTGLRWDHADIYPTEKKYRQIFEKLTDSIPKNGIIVCSDTIKSLRFTQDGPEIIRYGKNADSQYQYSEMTQNENGIRFKIKHKQTEFNINSPMIGQFMAENITGCFALANEVGIPSQSVIESIKKFPGLKRRLEKRYSGKIIIYDDIAHSPAKTAFTLQNLRRIYNGKIFAVFEPNTGNRQPSSAPGYKNAFADADQVLIPRLSIIKKDPDKQAAFDGQELARVISRTHTDTKYIESDTELVDYLNRNTDQNDVVVFLGSRGFRGMIEQLIEKQKEAL